MSTILKRSKKLEQKHPHIEKVKGVCGGRAKISGTRFPVSSVAGYTLKLGITPEELVRHFEHLTLAQIYDALSYYYDHQEEINREIDENTDSRYWKRKIEEMYCQRQNFIWIAVCAGSTIIEAVA